MLLIINLIAGVVMSSRRDGVVVSASALQLVVLGFISHVESYQKT